MTRESEDQPRPSESVHEQGQDPYYDQAYYGAGYDQGGSDQGVSDQPVEPPGYGTGQFVHQPGPEQAGYDQGYGQFRAEVPDDFMGGQFRAEVADPAPGSGTASPASPSSGQFRVPDSGATMGLMAHDAGHSPTHGQHGHTGGLPSPLDPGISPEVVRWADDQSTGTQDRPEPPAQRKRKPRWRRR